MTPGPTGSLTPGRVDQPTPGPSTVSTPVLTTQPTPGPTSAATSGTTTPLTPTMPTSTFGTASPTYIIPKLHGMGPDYCTETNKCGMCEGDCDTNDDCEGELICYQRDSYENVPGCEGNDSSRKYSTH